MAQIIKRRGLTWQCPEWRDAFAGPDLNERAQQALMQIEAAARTGDSSPPGPDSVYRLARMVAPFCGDGIPAGGAFSIRPEFRGFA